MIVVLCSGALAGLVLFAIQHFTVVPLIEAAEQYEKDADHHGTDWKPADGWERTAWTVVTTLLTGIGFAAVLFGFLTLTRRKITLRQGVLWGLAAFGCFHLAPSLGLPPLPPGVPVSDVQPRQLWWMCAVLGAAAGLLLLTGRTWMHRIVGAIVIAMPHLIGAPGRRRRQRPPCRADAEVHHFFTRQPRDVLDAVGCYRRIPVITRGALTRGPRTWELRNRPSTGSSRALVGQS